MTPQLVSGDPAIRLPGVGPATAAALTDAGLETVQNILDMLPVSYKDYTRPLHLAEADGSPHLYEVFVSGTPRGTWRRGRHMITLSVADGDGRASAAVRLFNQPYLMQTLAPGVRIYMDGTARSTREGLVFSAPTVFSKLPGSGIVPVYRHIADLAPGRLRRIAAAAVELVQLEDPCSSFFLERYRMLPLHDAYRAVHVPRTMAEQEEGRRRFAFENGLITVRALDLLGTGRVGENDWIIGARDRIHSFEDRLPFTLTGAQRRAISEVAADLEGDCLMNRLVEGDVGSGKTAVALFAMYAAAEEGYQSLMLAPTEALAAQHAAAVRAVLGSDHTVLVTGAQSAAERRQAQQQIRSGAAHCIVGTHALLYSGLRPPKAALLVTDEQHRFGVRQRRILLGERGMHSLIMSATPIPRSLALALGGVTQISVLDELPPGRLPVKTRLVPGRRVPAMYDFLAERARNGHQSYVVCPLVETNPDLELHAAVEMHSELVRQYPDLQIGLLHGQMSALDKDQVLGKFRGGEVSILVTTTVIEVGIDVPNATAMVIHDADRFGLAQLHQLRGRVGRGAEQSWCFMTTESPGARSRLQTLCSMQNGFDVAEADLKERGVGEVLGLRQHGRRQELLDIRETWMVEGFREVLNEMAQDPRLRSDYLRIAALAQDRVDSCMRDVVLN